ncbi:hypothetical protein [Metabacillus fastidiosus]|uniref:hypothetical protein n=1 Tax=Metabacillus fastidiosus TaxID=1458 RepID=UPI002E24432B|nr:hypothetical protein [Metabacillus fastidiosus]
MKMQFLNKDHQLKFQELRESMPEHYRNHRRYLTAIFLMTSNEDLEQTMSIYFDPIRGQFLTHEMFKEVSFSKELEVIAKLAVHLYGDSKEINVLALLSYLDDEYFQLAINAIEFYRSGVSSQYDSNEEKLYIA